MAANFIKVRSGRRFYYATPQEDSFRISDIAHAASNLCRFNGHTRKFFSVAQHSIECAYLAYDLADQASKERAALACLLHDAHEAYIGDFPTPFKSEFIAAFEQAENRVIGALHGALGITELMAEQDSIVKSIDRLMLFSDALRWGMDGTLEIDGVEYASAREWVPEDFQPYFPLATPAPAGAMKGLFVHLYHKWGGDRYLPLQSKVAA